MVRPDPSTLLCERCGYPLTGLPEEARCPECGTPIFDSLPVRRSGSPWQAGPSARAWLAGAGAMLRHPVATWAAVRATDDTATFGLLILNITLAAVGATVWLHWVLPALVLLLLPFAIFLLTLIEYAGIRTFGKVRRRRITRPVATAIVAHASYGWLFGSLAGILLRAVVLLLDSSMARPIGPTWLLGVAGAGALAALLWFEILVYLGVRAMRFANSPGATTHPPLTGEI